MRRIVHRASVVATTLAMLVTLSACGDKTPAKANSSASTAVSASVTPTSSPLTTDPAQPEGKHGVTFTVVNWARYATNPVVLAWKQTFEAFYGSVNAREPNADFLKLTAKAQRRLWVGNINFAREHDLVGAKALKGKVARVKITGNKAVLFGCDLRETTNFRPRGQKYTDSERGFWQMRNTFEKIDGRWVMTDSAPRGRCPKGV